MTEYEHKVIAQGWYGIIVQPPIPCIKDIGDMYYNKRYIGKISNQEELEKEYAFICKYLKFNTLYSRYVKEKDIVLCKINASTIKDKSLRSDVEGDNKEYQLIMPFLGNGLTFGGFLERYKNVCNKKSKGEILSIQEYKKIIIALKQLYHELQTLNDNKVYHNDIKSNNIIYMEEENELLLIDYNNSITSKIQEEFATNVKFYQSFYDIYCFSTLILFPFLKVAFTNQSIYFSPLFSFYEEWKQLMDLEIVNAMKGLEAINDEQILKELKERIEQFFILSESLKEDSSKENEEDAFCTKKYISSRETQKKRASLWNTAQNKLKEENQSMAMEDKVYTTRKNIKSISESRGGKKNKKTYKKTNKKTRKFKKCLA